MAGEDDILTREEEKGLAGAGEANSLGQVDEDAEKSGSESEDDEEDEEEEQQVEWLVTTREKRSTAGNRMNSLLQAEEPDDELELLFAEADDDAGFSDVEDGSDVQMDSSSDEEDQGPVDGDDLEGEKELQRQARAEAKKKKKDIIPRVFKKKVRIDPTVPVALSASKTKKKADRVSWLANSDKEAPKRQSSRKTTQAQKETLREILIDRESKRLSQVINMKKAAEQKAANERPPLTQEDRLKEAARVEKANARSLTKWEEAENAREEERKAKLAKLHNRTLEGPVITFWSGMAEYVGGKLRKVGKVEIEEKEKPAKKRKAAEMEAESEGRSTPMPDAPVPSEVPVASNPTAQSGSTASGLPTTSETAPLSMLPNGIPTHSNDKPSTPTSLPQPYNPPLPPPPNSSVLAPPAGFALFAPPHIPFAPQPHPSLDGSAPLPGLGYNYHPHAQPQPLHNYPPPPRPPTPPPAIEHTLRSSLIFENFDEAAIKSKDTQLQVLFGPGNKFEKVPKSRSLTKRDLCAITGYPARYRDPETGLPYCNSFAYREIQRLKRGELKWSKLVGAYVGVGTYGARGVPEGFVKRAEEDQPLK